MLKSPLQKSIKDSYYSKYIPAFIQIPTLNSTKTINKPIHKATLDDLAFAIDALKAEQNAIYKRSSALRELYSKARAKGALGAKNIVDALSYKGNSK